MKEYYGIDVSSHNENIDWSKARNISFAILRVTQRYGIDSTFEHNYKGAVSAGLKVGVYRFSYARNAEDSRKEAEGVISTLAGRHLDFPVFLDLEWEEQETMSKSTLASIVNAFRDVILKAGYKFAIYTGKWWYDDLLSDDIKSKCEFWIAAVPKKANDNGTLQERLRPSIGVGWQYSWKLKIPGFGGPFDADVFYKDYSENDDDKKDVRTVGVTANDILSLARSWIGKNEGNGSHKSIIDIYNSQKTLPRGYKVQYSDQWCDTCVSALFVKLNAVSLIGGTECGVEEHVKIFKNAGIWEENGSITPKPGYIIIYNWDKASQPNDGFSDHIGIVEKVSGGSITVIEGNYKDSVGRRTIPVGWGYIRGYAKPKYATESSAAPEATQHITPSAPVAHASSSLPELQYGSTLGEVSNLQEILNHFGYNLQIDGSFGPKTKEAVVNFQNVTKLNPDGIVGPATWNALLKVRPQIMYGSQGVYVKLAQYYFNNLGEKLVVDGSFGDLTRSAAVRFQLKNKLIVDGIVGPATWNALIAAQPKLIECSFI